MSVYINGVSQDVDPRDGTLAVGEAKTGATFYAGSVTKKTASGTQTLSDANENVTAGYYTAITLSAVDGDLDAANVADGVTVFGFLGTLTSVPLEDVTGTADTADTANAALEVGYKARSIDAETEVDLATRTLTFDADSRTVAVGFACAWASEVSKLILRLYMDGSIEDSAYVPTACEPVILVATSAIPGADTICKVSVYNEDGVAAKTFYSVTDQNGGILPFGIGVGSIKV